MESSILEHIKRRSTAQKARADYSIDVVDEHTFHVSKPDGTTYTVDLDAKTCTCPDFSRRLSRRQEMAGVWCKHIHLCAAWFLRA